MPQNESATEYEIIQRLDLVESLLVKGMEQAEIVRYIREKQDSFGGLSDRQLRNYVYEARERLSEAAKGIDRAIEFSIAKLRNDLIFNGAYRIADYRTALTANFGNVKLMRLDKPNADFDWREAARQAGIDPQDVQAQWKEMFNDAASAKAKR